MQSTERGAVALITAMIVSVLLMITTAGMVSVTVKSLRQSTDGAQSTKAYYAAEGGLEETLLKLRNDPDYAGSCNGASSSDSAKDGVVTCAKVIKAPNQVEGVLDVNGTDQIDLSSVPSFSEITLEWSGLNDTAAGFAALPNYVQDGFPGGRGTSSTVKYPENAPSVMELGVVEYPDSQSFLIDQVRFLQGVIAPKGNGVNDPTRVLTPDTVYSYDGSGNRPYIGTCTLAASAAYHCKVVIGNFNRAGARKYVLRLKSRYNGAKYKISVANGGVPVTIPGAMYTVDVTARAGDTFRRIQTSFPLNGTASSEGLSGLDYVLYSDSDICKSFEIKGGTAQDLACSTP
jgi:hypothetical protein